MRQLPHGVGAEAFSRLYVATGTASHGAPPPGETRPAAQRMQTEQPSQVSIEAKSAVREGA